MSCRPQQGINMGLFSDHEAAINKLRKAFLFGKTSALARAKESLGQIKKYVEELEKEKTILNQQMQEAKKDILSLRNGADVLAGEIEEKNAKLKNYDFVSDALGAKPTGNAFITEFEQLIKSDFVQFCDIESNLNDTISLRKLEHIQKEMRLIANCPALYGKSIGAIGGGVSSGKSAFVNSFLASSKIRLAEGNIPVTAIPSYVICNKDSKINGISYKGGCFNIELDMYKAISHKFIKSFSFNLKEIILYTTVLAPMEETLFGNLCLIDTPGYNPPGSGSSATDFETAQEYIKDAQFLIWVVGLDNGTIPESDLKFIDKLEFGRNKERPLYIIASKASWKSNGGDIKGILDTFVKCLDEADLQYAGISAYDSKAEEKLYDSRKMNIFEFLKKHNKPSQKYDELSTILEDVFSDYIKEIHRDYNEKETKRKEVKNLKLKAFESGNIGMDDSANDLEDGLNGLEQYFQSQEDLKKRIQRVEELRDKFIDCFNRFCDEMGIDRTGFIFCTNCGKKLRKTALFCTKCGAQIEGSFVLSILKFLQNFAPGAVQDKDKKKNSLKIRNSAREKENNRIR
jgi:hypothetical protein